MWCQFPWGRSTQRGAQQLQRDQNHPPTRGSCQLTPINQRCKEWTERDVYRELTISLNIKLHHIPLLLKATAVFRRFLNKLRTCFVGRHKCHPFSAIWLHLTPLSVPLNTPTKQVFQCSSVWGSLQRLLLPFWSLFKAGVPASHKSLSCSELSSSPGKKQARPTACRRWGSGNQQKCWPSGHHYCLGVRKEPLALGPYVSCRHPRNQALLWAASLQLFSCSQGTLNTHCFFWLK